MRFALHIRKRKCRLLCLSTPIRRDRYELEFKLTLNNLKPPRNLSYLCVTLRRNRNVARALTERDTHAQICVKGHSSSGYTAAPCVRVSCEVEQGILQTVVTK
ncbi:hypothetical protein FOQG_01128 [Fusarium oxysporum f. sp. raphani 54005]|uniref:Uncharacterized protein n=5 Tax=Fusarium oxysporum TaxID=5507 RepID=X0D3G3_FUSOX|nr:hypothetical protein FOZG_08357 [Fusarium oxysporum Fo47]EWZ83852.1 hypothetical protein FOWG_12746 [Fusarium oxysporum f. sp. lycopersici MN25]EXA39992.1 hypothetical protein FOVG_08968 [Fusarium oxysporum f. sp. pisi HDV247]EXK98118.1 hypothetical protein FOQG_01128 [Fusarium oxysporum f. sp. raphani 54005]EXL84013.1 hypothetical protein FOPG_03573 [Fusarium oxysporum f. sp. conglutinans race 2 54008]EXM23366.1 hypothetical protein FOTG_09247 [Fusarium oxysporum f. sp. vasinfectum 25433]